MKVELVKDSEIFTSDIPNEYGQIFKNILILLENDGLINGNERWNYIKLFNDYLLTHKKRTIDNFWNRVKKTKTCWIWNGFKDKNGYGYLKFMGKTLMAHRFTYELFKSSIPKGYEIHHICKNPSCINPDHLEALTVIEHRRIDDVSRVRRNKTHCPQGHLYSGENLYKYPYGRRACRTCVRKSMIKNRNKQK